VDIAIFFARGTTQPGTLGTIIGPGLQRVLCEAPKNPTRSLNFTGIDYPATILGFLAGGDAGGAQTMIKGVTSTPIPARIVMSGYKQAFLR